MELSSTLFSGNFTWWVATLYLFALLSALRMAPWRRLLDNEQLHVFLGSCVVLILLWHVRAQVDPAWSFHLLGVTFLTLMFGWSLALICSSIALAAVTLNLDHGWSGFFLNAIILGLLPITLTQVILVLVRSLLPKNFFIYVLVNGFLTAGFVALVSGYLVTGLLVYSGAFSMLELKQNFLPFFPLMFLPEAILNGWVMTILVLYRPRWVGSFSDELYLKGK
jgi:uncharacterized membrane protein